MIISEQEADKLCSDKKYVYSKDLIWKRKQKVWHIDAPVYIHGQPESGSQLRLRATYTGRKYSFIVTYGKHNQVVRLWDCDRHRNPETKETIHGSHKHRWTDKYGSRWNYPVTDVCTDDVAKGLRDFLVECNIELKGDYQPHLFEGGD